MAVEQKAKLEQQLWNIANTLRGKMDADSIIGRPTKIGNIEIAQHDFPEYKNWDDSKKACADLGNGWRLPTKDELNLMYENKDNIRTKIKNGFYWSSTEYDSLYSWYFYFGLGYANYGHQYDTYYVRAVRSF